MKFQIYKAIDKLDGELSLFMFDETDGYTVVTYSKSLVGKLCEQARAHGCDWTNNPGETPRRKDMIDPVLLCEVNV